MNTKTAALLLACFSACGTETGTPGPTGGKTNWLAACERNVDCRDLPEAECTASQCTRECANDLDCSELGSRVTCDVAVHVCVSSAESGPVASADPDSSSEGAQDTAPTPEPVSTSVDDGDPTTTDSEEPVSEPAPTVEPMSEPDSTPAVDPVSAVEPDASMDPVLELCDGSDEIRFFTTTGGGFVDEYYAFYGAYGYSFLAIDGQCNYWSASRSLGLVRTGALSEERAREIAAALSLGQLGQFPEDPYAGCTDATTTVLRDPAGQVNCYCDACTNADAPPALAAMLLAALDLSGDLFATGSDVTGPAQLLIVEDPYLEPRGAGLSWPLELEPLSVVFVYDPNLGAEQVTPDSGQAITQSEELAALRTLRVEWLQSNEYQSSGDPYVHATHVSDDAGAATHLRVYLRDLLPDHVKSAFDPR